MFDVALKESVAAALLIPYDTSETTVVVATRCEFANSKYGAVVHGSLSSATFNNLLFQIKYSPNHHPLVFPKQSHQFQYLESNLYHRHLLHS